MEEKDLPKKRQHFIPQVYLRGFSPEYEPLEKLQIPNSKYTIFAYDIEKNAYDSMKSVPISSVCCKDLLYEIYGKDGQIIFPNWLENYFQQLEIMYGKYRGKLERKTNKENIGMPDFLTTKERTFWITFITIHLLRNLYALSEAEKVIKEMMSNHASDKEIKSIVRKYCLPFFQEIKTDSCDIKIFERVLTPMLKMHFAVGMDFDNRIITSDKGATIIAKELSVTEYDKVIFPITSSICLFLFSDENVLGYQDNVLYKLTEDGRNHVTTNVVLDAYRKIYSNHRFSVSEKRLIKEAAAMRTNDNPME